MNSPRKANIFIFLFLIYSILLQIGIGIYASGLDENEIISFQYYITVFQDFLLILIPLIAYFIITKTKPADFIPHKRLSFKNACYVILITFFSLPVLLVIANIAALFFEDTANDTITQLLTEMDMTTAFFSMAIMPAIFEESLCRGVVMSNYKTASPIVMYVISGLFFGIIHLNFQQMSYAVAAGILFALFVNYTNSIYSSMLAHLFINGYQVILGKLLVPAETIAESDVYDLSFNSATDYISYGISFVIIIVLFLLFIYVDLRLIKNFMKCNKDNAEEYMNNESGTNKKFIDFYFIAVIVIFIVMSFVLEIYSV